MVDEKKFLDQNGVEYLWSQLSLEDYPNNETLIAILNAIDTTKQDKNLIVTKGADGLATHSPAEILEAVNNGANVYYTPNANAGTLHPYLEGSNQVSYFHSNYIDNSKVIATGFLIDSNKNITVSNYSALDNYYNKTEVDELHSSLEEYVNSQAENSVKKYFLIVETVREGADYLLDGMTFDEIYEKFNTGNVNMVCHVDGTDYIPLLSVTRSSIIFSGIYNTTSVSLVFNTEGVGTLTSTYLMQNGSLSNYYTKTEVDNLHNNLDSTKADKNDVKQSDWNENDSTSAAYVQNRTHYEYSGNVFTQEINLDYLDNQGAVTFLYSSQEGDMNFPLVEGYSYNITIEAEGMDTFISENNVCFNYDDNGSLAIGDPSLLQREISPLITDGVQTFTYGQVNGNYILRLTAVGVSTVGELITAKITIEENAFLKTLDEKFIPNTIARKDYVNSQVAALVNSAPETLDTLGELATAFEENQEVIDVLDASITNKQDKITGTSNQLVGFDESGNMIAKTPTTETWTFTLADGTVVTK